MAAKSEIEMSAKAYYVYVMTDRHRSTVYTGVTNDLQQRVYEHKAGLSRGFTAKYHAENLVYFEETADIRGAISREKQIKVWRRSRKVALIESANPNWDDLSRGWFSTAPPPDSFAKITHSAGEHLRRSE